MKGVILAGGEGTRLKPLTNVTNKHLLPVGSKPMIYYPIETLKNAGIEEILVITGKNHAGDVFSLLGSGKEFGVRFTFRVQDEAGGIPQAISLAENFVGDDKFVAINGDNILIDSIKDFVEEFDKGAELSRVLLYEGTEEQAKKSGIAILEGDNVMEVVEKPSAPKSHWVVVGVYMYTPKVFEVIKGLKPSARGELEISDVHNRYIKEDSLRASKLQKQWFDAGTVEELMQVNEEIKKLKFD